MELLTVPENRKLVAQAIGLEEFVVPGTDDVIKQQEEIQLLVQSQPIVQDGMELPSIMVEELVDNHEIGWDICREWLVGEAGRLAKQENPQGYRNVLLHGQMHFIIQQQGMQMLNAAASANPQNKSGEKEKPEPEAAQSKQRNVIPE